MLGFKANIGNWLSTFLIERTQSVKVDGIISEPKTIVSGVPQGSVLGPVMFLIFIADIGLSSKANSWIYVDDSKVTMPVENEEDVLHFQDEMEEYYSWARHNNMSYNNSKFVAL